MTQTTFSPQLAPYCSNVSLGTFFQKTLATPLSVALTAVGYYTSSRLAYVGAALSALKPVFNWYQQPSFVMSPGLNGETVNKQVQNLYSDLLHCGLSEENRKIAISKFDQLVQLNPALFDAESIRLIGTLQAILTRVNDAPTATTATFDMERLYLELALQNGAVTAPQRAMYENLCRLLQPCAGRPEFQRQRDMINVIYGVITKGPATNTLAFDVRALLVSIQKGSFDRNLVIDRFNLLRPMVDANAFRLKEEAIQDLHKIHAFLVPMPASTAPTSAAPELPAQPNPRFATLHTDVEKLYFELCLQRGVARPEQLRLLENLKAFLAPYSNASDLKRYIDLVNVIDRVAKRRASPGNFSVHTVVFDIRCLALGLKTGAIGKSAASDQYRLLHTMLSTVPASLKEDAIRDLNEIYTALVPPAATAPQRPAATVMPAVVVPQRPAAAPAPANDCPPPPVDDCCPVPECGLPNFGRPKLANICWMNSACQLIFRSSLIRKIEEKVRLNQATPHLLLLKQLKDAIVARKPRDEIQDIQEGLIDCYKAKNPGFVIGAQHDPREFLGFVIQDLGISLSTTFENEQGVAQKSENLWMVGYRPGASYLQSIQASPVISAAINTTDSSNRPRVIKATIHHMNRVPEVILFRFQMFQNRSFNDVPLNAEFSSLFTDDIRSRSNGNLRYHLVVADQHSNPGSGSGGHYTAQQRDGDNHHYNDLIVSSLPVSAALRNFLNSPIHLWEIDDPALVTR